MLKPGSKQKYMQKQKAFHGVSRTLSSLILASLPSLIHSPITKLARFSLPALSEKVLKHWTHTS